MFFILLPFFLFARFIFLALLVTSAAVIVLTFYAVTFLVTLAVYGAGKLIRAERRPPRPTIPPRGRPPQSRYSDRR